MGAYRNFAYYYDALNAEANYDALAKFILSQLSEKGIHNGLVADLGCGTGEMTLRLASARYDMLAVDASADMLAVFREKVASRSINDILLLCQNLTELDLYGTIQAAVSTFDVLNHLPGADVEEALKRVSLFLEPGGLFLFDANTPYKHESTLANSEIVVEAPNGITCVWNNRYDAAQQATHIQLQINQDSLRVCREEFVEYSYSLSFWKEALHKAGLQFQNVVDGETFSPLTETSNRYFIVAGKPFC